MLFFKGRLICFEDGTGEGGGGGGTGEGGGGGDNWLDNLPEDLGTNPGLQKFKGPEDLAKSYLEIQKMMGKDKVVIPGENSTDEERAAFWKRLGRPDDATAYEFDALEEPPEGFQYPAELETEFKKWVHSVNMPASMAKGLWSKIVGHNAAQFKDNSGKLSTLKSQQETALKEEWGANFEAREDLATKWVAAINSKIKNPEHKIPISIAKLPLWKRVFAIAAEDMAEDFLGAGEGGNGGIMTARQAKTRIQEIREDPDYMNAENNPAKHKRLTEEASRLYGIAYPD